MQSDLHISFNMHPHTYLQASNNAEMGFLTIPILQMETQVEQG